jgi:hypothetical protein
MVLDSKSLGSEIVPYETIDLFALNQMSKRQACLYYAMVSKYLTLVKINILVI